MVEQQSTQDSLSTKQTKTIEDYAKKLYQSKNIIFHGAPGTGKTYLARQIATYIVSDGRTANYSELDSEEAEQIGFVQFHPSYDYTDFVEGLRPVRTDDGLGFELRDGIFKQFVDQARSNYENSLADEAELERKLKWERVIPDYLNEAIATQKELQINSTDSFQITKLTKRRIKIKPENYTPVYLTIAKLKDLLASKEEIKHAVDVRKKLARGKNSREASYYLSIYQDLKDNDSIRESQEENNEEYEKEIDKAKKKRNYVFIIDEINRGEISKIFGELFFAIDPGYRGPQGAVSTQYSNMKTDSDESDESEPLFYIPDNVYIIGTMNDIDRSVDIFDFAMRRRFRFINLKASDTQSMLEALGDNKDDAIRRMNRLNDTIADVDGLGPNYQIGAAYFLKFKDMNAESLWSDYLEPLLQTYLQGLPNADTSMNKLESAFKRTTESTETDSTNASEGSGTVDNQLPVESS